MIEAFDKLAAEYEAEISELLEEIEELRAENRRLRNGGAVREDDPEGETGIISRMAEARSYDNQPPLNDGLDDDNDYYDEED